MPSYQLRCTYCGRDIEVKMSMNEFDKLKQNKYNRWYERCLLCYNPAVKVVPAKFTFKMT